MKNDNRMQVIHDAKGAPVFAVVPWADYKRLCKSRDEGHSEDAALIRLVTPYLDDEAFPAAVANRLMDGEVPLKVIREWRDLSQAELADKAKVAPGYISQLERRDGDRKLGRKTAGALAKVLGVSVEVLLDL